MNGTRNSILCLCYAKISALKQTRIQIMFSSSEATLRILDFGNSFARKTVGYAHYNTATYFEQFPIPSIFLAMHVQIF